MKNSRLQKHQPTLFYQTKMNIKRIMSCFARISHQTTAADMQLNSYIFIVYIAIFEIFAPVYFSLSTRGSFLDYFQDGCIYLQSDDSVISLLFSNTRISPFFQIKSIICGETRVCVTILCILRIEVNDRVIIKLEFVCSSSARNIREQFIRQKQCRLFMNANIYNKLHYNIICAAQLY